MQLCSHKFLSTLLSFKHDLRAISFSSCTFGRESFAMTRSLFRKCPLLTSIKLSSCYVIPVDRRVIDLLHALPVNVIHLLIGEHVRMNLDDLLAIVSSNPQLEVLWFADCDLDSENIDYESIKVKVRNCGGKNLRIIDSLWPEFCDGFFDQCIL